MGRIRKPAHGPEYHIQEDLMEYMKARGWLVERMIGNAFQVGIPDLYCFHPRWGERWIDVKNPESYSFTKAQRIKWPVWEDYKCGIWILTAASQEEYDKLFAPPNFRQFWKPSWDERPDVEAMIDELAKEAATVDVRRDQLRNGPRPKRKRSV